MERAGWCRAAWLAALFVIPAAVAGAAPVCAVTALEGEARVQRQGEWVALTAGMLAPSDGQVETGPGARVQVTCDDGTVVSIGPDSRVDLAGVIAAAAEQPSLVVRLLSGIAGFVRPEATEIAFTVGTPVAIAAVRTTEWLVEHEEGAATAVFARSGRVAVSNATASVVLEPGEGITLDRDAVLRPVARWGEERIRRSTGALGFGWN